MRPFEDIDILWSVLIFLKVERKRVNVWRWAALIGIAMIGFMMTFPAISGLKACSVATDPILAFEMARSLGAVAASFPENCRTTLMEAQRRGLVIDTFGFIPVYTAFIIVSAMGARTVSFASTRRLATYALVLTIFAAASDLVENGRMLAILNGLPGTQNEIDILAFAARAKFVLLGGALMLIGIMHTGRRGWCRWLGVMMALGAAFCAVAVFTNLAFVPVGASLAWMSLLLITFVLAVRPAGSPTAAEIS